MRVQVNWRKFPVKLFLVKLGGVSIEDTKFVEDYYGISSNEHASIDNTIDNYVSSSLNNATAAKSQINQISDNEKLSRGTQKYFKERGISEITLYRGVTKDIAPDAGEITLKNRSEWKASSWTDKSDLAANFAGGRGEVLQAKIPVSQIVTCHKTWGYFKKSEGEYIVKGDVKNATQFKQMGKPKESIGKSITIELSDDEMMWLRSPEVRKKIEESESDFSSWDPSVLATENEEELIARIDSIYELWTTRGASEQDEDVLNAYLILKAELEKREIEFEPIEEFETMEARLDEGIRPAFGSPGGKRNIAAAIINLFPEHKTYIEPFVGGGAIFFRKNPSEKEYINDLDSQIYNAYKTLQKATPQEIIEAADKYDWISREDRLRKAWTDLGEGVDSFINFLYGIRGSFGCNRQTISRWRENKSIKPNFSTYQGVHERLNGVHILKEDYQKLKEYDSSDSFFYFDPPYPGEWPRGLKTKTFSLTEFVKFLEELKGKFIVSINKENRKFFEGRDWEIKEIPRLTMFSQARRNPDPTKRKTDIELLIANFPMKENHDWLSESVMSGSLEEGIRPAFGSSGEKKYLARTICSYMPEHKIYVEPFIGGGAVFFKKNPSEKEVINDLDKEISGAYKYIKEGKFEGLNKYRKDGDRKYFDDLKKSEPKTLEEQFHKFIYVLHFSFGNGRTNFAPSIVARPGLSATMECRLNHLPKVHERLKNAEVKNEDFRNLLKEYDSKETFFYLDPPYPEQQGKLKTDLKNEDLWEAVKDLKGKWIMSLPDTQTARKTFHSCFIEGVEVRRTFNMVTEHKDMELLISNFPLKQSTTWIAESVAAASWLDDWVLEVKAKIDEVGNIILTPNYICWTGSSLYAKDRVPNDIDWVVRDQAINPDWLLKINRLCQKLLGTAPCLHQTPEGPNWRHFPLYNLALVPVKNAEFQEIGDDEPGFADMLYESKMPPEDYPQNYGTLTIHFRGKSSHLDFRRKQDGYLEGETIMTQPEGLVTEEVDTIEKGKKWTAVLFEKGKFRPDMDPNEKVVMVEKKQQPLIWLNAREVSYDPGTVGATKFEPGVFITMDEGMVYPGAQKPHFKEFFLDMKKFKGRMVERIIGVGPEWDNPPEGKTEWQTWFNLEDQTPYILSKRQRKDKRDYIPADGEKSIPPEWEQKIQPGFRWWVKDLDDKEKMHRLDLAYSDLIERGFINADKLSEEQLQNALSNSQPPIPGSYDVTSSNFPIDFKFENTTYTLVKTKNGKLLLQK